MPFPGGIEELGTNYVPPQGHKDAEATKGARLFGADGATTEEVSTKVTTLADSSTGAPV